jgi:branched-chain amino acid transport system ATP-binding protein
MGVSDRIVCLNQGRIIASGTPAEIRGNPEVIRAYLGEKYVNRA